MRHVRYSAMVVVGGANHYPSTQWPHQPMSACQRGNPAVAAGRHWLRFDVPPSPWHVEALCAVRTRSSDCELPSACQVIVDGYNWSQLYFNCLSTKLSNPKDDKTENDEVVNIWWWRLIQIRSMNGRGLIWKCWTMQFWDFTKHHHLRCLIMFIQNRKLPNLGSWGFWDLGIRETWTREFRLW